MLEATYTPGAPQLRAALQNGRLQIFAQRAAPLRDLTRTAAIECMPRLMTDDGTVVRSAELVSAAARLEMLASIEEWTIDHALTILQPYASLLIDNRIQVAFTVSEPSLCNDDFLHFLQERIRRSDVLPTLLAFQIRESIAARNLARMDIFMRRLRTIGCRMALDDFGTRLVSLAHLQSFRPHSVRLAGEVACNVLLSADSEMTVQTIVELAEALQVECVAKSIPSEALLRKLREMGVGYAQGSALHVAEPLHTLLDSLDETGQQRQDRSGDKP